MAIFVCLPSSLCITSLRFPLCHKWFSGAIGGSSSMHYEIGVGSYPGRAGSICAYAMVIGYIHAIQVKSLTSTIVNPQRRPPFTPSALPCAFLPPGPSAPNKEENSSFQLLSPRCDSQPLVSAAIPHLGSLCGGGLSPTRLSSSSCKPSLLRRCLTPNSTAGCRQPVLVRLISALQWRDGSRDSPAGLRLPSADSILLIRQSCVFSESPLAASALLLAIFRCADHHFELMQSDYGASLALCKLCRLPGTCLCSPLCQPWDLY